MESSVSSVIDMSDEIDRFISLTSSAFQNGLDNDIRKTLAKIGFYFSDRDKCLACYFCKQHWEDCDNVCSVIENHKLISPNCAYSDTEPQNRTDTGINNPSLYTEYGVQEAASADADQLRESLANTLDTQHGEPLNDFESRPKFPEYEFRGKRTASFPSDWQLKYPISHRSLAEAGLFYAGHEDRVQCFHCGGILYKWEPNDNPRIEHRRWYPNCHFAKKKIELPETKSSGETAEHHIINEDQNNNILPDPNLLDVRKSRKIQSRPLQWSIWTKQYEEIVTLHKENTELKRDLAMKTEEAEKLRCYICLVKDRCVLMPCKHVIICNECAGENCPVCRCKIESLMNVFYS